MKKFTKLSVAICVALLIVGGTCLTSIPAKATTQSISSQGVMRTNIFPPGN